MAVVVKHAFTSPVVDAGNPNEVGPAEWNADHTVTGALDQAAADALYVNVTGDTMSGALKFPNGDGVLQQLNGAGTAYLYLPAVDANDYLFHRLPSWQIGGPATGGPYVGTFATIQMQGSGTPFANNATILNLVAGGINGSGSIIAVNATASADDNFIASFTNYKPTTAGATSGTRLLLATDPAGGDPRINFNILGVTDWAFGIDNDQGDRLAWSTNSWLGTSDKMTLDTSGNLTVAGKVLAAGNPSSLAFIIDGGGSAITTGIKGDLEIPFDCTIQQWTLLADQSGSIVIDVWKDTYANFPPVVADTITASAKPTISAAAKAQSSTLTGWSPTIAAGSILRFNVDSISTITRVTLSLKVIRT